MASKAERQINSFIKGLITESNPLTFPENASLDEDNFILNRDGSRQRRLGMEFEDDYVLNASGVTTLDTVSFHEWKLSGGSADISIGVVRIYNKLWFIDMLSRSPSANLLNSSAAITLSQLYTAEISTTVINNALLVVSKDLPYPIRLTYDSSTDTVTQQEYKVYVRDFWGVYDGLIDNERPTVISNCHRYNLLNQGWGPSVQTNTGVEPIQYTANVLGKYPSNSDIWSIGKVSDNTSADYEKYDPSTMVRNMHDFLTAPRGKHIIDIFNRGESREDASGITVAATSVNGSSDPKLNWGTSFNQAAINTSNPVSTSPVATTQALPIDKETGTFTTIAAYAGRVWYSGIRSAVIDPDKKSPNLGGYVVYSQTVTNDDKLGKCYQAADPSSPDISDIIDTDGGVIHIVDAINIIALVPTKSTLLVFAENGVWQISGGMDNFTATTSDLTKVSSIGCTSAKSIVSVNDQVFYWSKGGIFRVASGQDGLSSENLSLTSIQTLYNNIPEVGRRYTKGVFEEKQNTIRWLYNDSITYTGTSSYNRELVLDLTLGAFYTNTISNLTISLCDFVKIPDYAASQTEDEVLIGSDPVLVGASEVVVNVTSNVQRDSPYSYLVVNPTTYQFTVAKYRSTTFLDWTIATGGTDYSSYLVTGYDIFGEILRHKQVPYILFYFDRTEDGFSSIGGNLVLDNQSSCLVQAQWNWTNSVASGKWGRQFQAYRLTRPYIPTGVDDTFDYGDRVIVTKNKLRGSGRALSLKIQSETGKDMKILGWAHTITGDTVP